MIVKIVGRMAPGWEWLAYTSFFTPFEPQLLVGDLPRAWSLWIEHADGVVRAGRAGL